MKKNFLLLFLLTLLPLAGWALGYKEVSISPSDATATWCGGMPNVQRAWISVRDESDNSLITDGGIKEALATVLKAQTLDGEYGVGERSYKLSAERSTVEYGDVEYTIHINSSNTATLTITKYTEALPTITTTSLAYVEDPLTYDGEAKALLSGGATATSNGFAVPVVYALSETAETWTDDYASLTGTDAGTYTVYYKVAGTDNYVGSEPEALGEGKVIKKATVSFTNTVSAAGEDPSLTYNGANQSLLTLTDPLKPAVNFGASTLVYKVWTGDEVPAEWTAISETGIAAITGKNVGTYNVQLKVPASDNWYDGDDGAGGDHASIQEYQVAISRAQIVDEEMEAKFSAALVDPDAEFVFNYAEHTPALTVSYDNAELTVDDGDIAIAYADNTNAGDATATVTFNNYYLGDNPDEAYTKDVTFTIAPKSLGDETGAAEGITTFLQPGASVWTYNGEQKSYTSTTTKVRYTVGETPHNLDRNNDYTRTPVGDFTNATESVAEADKPYYLFTGKGNFTGTVKLPVSIAKANLTATVKSQNIAFGAELPLNEIDDETIAGLQGEEDFATVVGDITYTYKQDDETVETPSARGEYSIEATATADNYNVTFTSGTLTIGNATAYIVPVAKSKLYGAAEPTLTWKVEDAAGNTLDNNVLKGRVTLARQDGENVGTYIIYVVSYEANAADNYTVRNGFGVDDTKIASFTIFANTENTLVLKFKDDLDDAKKTKVYNGKTDVTFTADDFEAVSGLLNEDTWAALGGDATIRAELSDKNVADGITATATISGLANYPYIQVQAPLAYTITPRPITITANDQTIAQGSSIDQNEFVVSEDVAYGDVVADLNIELTATETAVGEWEDAIEVSAENANYDFTFVPGDLEITAADGITLGGDNDLQTIKDYADQNVNVTIDFTPRNERAATWKADTWVTMTLPFNITVGELSKKLGYAVVNEIDPSRTEIDGTSSKFYGKLTMKGAYTKEYLPANKPFMVKIADNIADVNNGIINFGPQDIVAPADDDDLVVQAGGGVKFTGTYTTKTVTSADNQATWFMTGSNSKWLYIGSQGSWDILPCEGFLDLSGLTEAQARNMTFVFEEIDGSKTAIKGISTDDLNNKNAEGWYNLKGMKMDGAPLQKGIYIKDGKKVVIK